MLQKELIHNPADGYFRLLGEAEALFYNLPLAYSNEKLLHIKLKLRLILKFYFKIEYVLILFLSNEEFFESETSLNDFEILGTIGKGGFGTILLAEAEGQKFAIKGLVKKKLCLITIPKNRCVVFMI